MRPPSPTDGLSQKLANSGLRSTPQREIIYNVLLQKRDHPTADEVYARVRAEMPTISLATVYNCLEALVQCKVVRAVNFERGPTRYCPNLHPHAHFHDEASGETYDIDLPPTLLDDVRAILPPGYNASSVEIVFRGVAKPGSDVTPSVTPVAKSSSPAVTKLAS
jgi:Fur family transcriptional regulator, peroxide stress response regulator